MSDEQPKIIVDDDWKSQAQAEKAKLAAAEAQKKAQQPAQAGSGAPGGAPTAEFGELIRMFALPALMYLGQMPDPQTGKAVVALDIARLHIDLLGLLEDKTRGNLSDEEQKLLSGTLNELRLAYVEIAKAIEQAVAEGKISPQDLSAMGAGGMGGFGAAPGSPTPPSADPAST